MYFADLKASVESRSSSPVRRSFAPEMTMIELDLMNMINNTIYSRNDGGADPSSDTAMGATPEAASSVFRIYALRNDIDRKRDDFPST